mmetsp:Transcript_28530/g.91448  ORF Transcript_28530/g.91448 Transcript_28530/m.91448 type:complete len:437 (+) Transcript_28530:574-1884(+)
MLLVLERLAGGLVLADDVERRAEAQHRLGVLVEQLRVGDARRALRGDAVRDTRARRRDAELAHKREAAVATVVLDEEDGRAEAGATAVVLLPTKVSTQPRGRPPVVRRPQPDDDDAVARAGGIDDAERRRDKGGGGAPLHASAAREPHVQVASLHAERLAQARRLHRLLVEGGVSRTGVVDGVVPHQLEPLGEGEGRETARLVEQREEGRLHARRAEHVDQLHARGEEELEAPGREHEAKAQLLLRRRGLRALVRIAAQRYHVPALVTRTQIDGVGRGGAGGRGNSGAFGGRDPVPIFVALLDVGHFRLHQLLLRGLLRILLRLRDARVEDSVVGKLLAAPRLLAIRHRQRVATSNPSQRAQHASLRGRGRGSCASAYELLQRLEPARRQIVLDFVESVLPAGPRGERLVAVLLWRPLRQIDDFQARHQIRSIDVN